MKQKLLMLLALVGFTLYAHASTWSKEAHDHAQANYEQLLPESKHRDYTWEGYSGFTWDPLWRNSTGRQDWTSGSIPVENHGHGLITAKEWDNSSNLYSTTNGRTYLIPWVWSNGTNYNYSNYEGSKYVYEGYARLLSRCFNTSSTYTGDYVRAYWSNGTAYAENVAYATEYISGTQQSYSTTGQHITVAGAWDITDTPYRADLYVAVDNAYNVRDAYSGDALVLPAAGHASKQINALLPVAITAFKDDTKSNDDYLAAAKHLNNRVALLQSYETNNTSYQTAKGALTDYKNNHTFTVGDNKYNAVNIPGVYFFLDSLEKQSAYGQTYFFAHSCEMVKEDNYAKAKNIADATTANAQAYFVNRVKDSNFKTAATTTKSGQTPISYVTAESCKLYTAQSKAAADAALATYKAAIDDVDTADVISETDAKAAANAYAEAMESAMTLYSAEVNAMAKMDSVARFVNETLQSKEGYNAIKAALTTAQAAVKDAETKEAVDNAIATLWEVFETKNGVNTQWNAVAWRQAQSNYEVLQSTVMSNVDAAGTMTGRSWDQRWRNTASNDKYVDGKVEKEGHGSIIATEWDNEENHYSTSDGHQYLISWNWSYGRNYNYYYRNIDGEDVGDRTKSENGKYKYEGYARLLSRFFNNCESTKYDSVYWASGTDYKGWIYVEKTTEGATKVEGSQRSYVANNEPKLTVAYALDITGTRSRATLFHQIDTAYTLRDKLNSSDNVIYPSDGYTYKTMTAEINTAIKAFDTDGQSDEFYATAAKALQSRMALLVNYDADKALYAADSTDYVKNNNAKEYEIADGSKKVGKDIPGVDAFFRSLSNSSTYGDTLSFAHSREMLNATNTAKVEKVAKLTTAKAVKYYAEINGDSIAFKRTVKSGVVVDGINKTKAGRDTIAWLTPETYQAYTSKADGVVIKAYVDYLKAIDAINAATVIDTVAAKKVVDDYVDVVQRATVLYSAEVNAMELIDSVTTFINDTLQSNERYDVLVSALVRAQNALKEATTKEEVDDLYINLYNEFVIENGVTSEWSKTTHDKLQVYYSELQPMTQHLDYTKYGNWYWDNAWRNSNGIQDVDESKEKGGHGSIVATEWDNVEGHYNTANGHKYLISWVWSDGQNEAYDNDSLVVNNTDATKYEYEGYARLLSRMFNTSDIATGDFVRAYWAKGQAYAEKVTEGTESEAVAGSQRSYKTNGQHITVAGAWDVTDTPNRDSLFHVIDQAFDIRDAYTGTADAPVLTYPADCKAHQQMDVEIKKAIEVFKKDGQADDVYKTAAIALKDRMNLLVQWHNDSTTFDGQSKEIAGYVNTYTNHEPGTGLLAKAVYDVRNYNQTYAFKHSFQLHKDEPAAITKVNALTTDRAKKFYNDSICTGNIYKKYYNHPTRVLNGTVAGYDTIPYLKKEAYLAYKSRSDGIVNAATDQYKAAIDAVYAAPAIDIAAADSAAAKFVDNAERAGVLFSAEVNAMSVLDEVATFVNDSCINFAEYDNIKAEYARTMKCITEAETKEAIDNQVAILYNVLAKARINNRTEVVMDSLRHIRNIAFTTNIKRMADNTPLKNIGYQSTLNLADAITSADNVLGTNITDNRSIQLNFNGKYDLYDNTWQEGTRDWVEETPVSRVVREDSTLVHAYELYMAQYDFETVIDSITALHHDHKYAWAYPKQILTNALDIANTVNNQITALRTKFMNDGKVIKPIEKVALAKKALLAADELALEWEKRIGDSIMHAQNVDTYYYYKPTYATDNENNPIFKESLDYYRTHQRLRAEIEADSIQLMTTDATINDTAIRTYNTLNRLWAYIQQQWIDDKDETYLGCGNVTDGVYQRAVAKYNTELEAGHMTEYQKEIFDGAIANGQAVRGEVENYQKTWSYPTHPRIYFAIWALDYAMQMSFGVGDFDKTITWEKFLNSEGTQLNESLAVVYCYLSSGKIVRTATVDEVLAEAKRVYESSYPTPEEKQEATSKLKKLIRSAESNATGINDVDVEADVDLKDGKYLRNGKLIIVKSGKQYNAAGTQMK